MATDAPWLIPSRSNLSTPAAFDDAFEVVDEGLERDLRRVPVGHAVRALIVADERMAARELVKPVAPDRALPVLLEMIEPVGRLHQRRPFAHDRKGQPGPVLGAGVADDLLRQSGVRELGAFLRFLLDLPAPGRRRLAKFALEGAGERGLRIEAHRISDVRRVLLAVAKHVGGHAHPPPRAVPHRRLADQLGKFLAEDGARNARLAREFLYVQVFGIAAVDDRQRLADRRVRQSAKPAARAIRQMFDIFPHRLRQEQLGQLRHDFRRRLLLGQEAHRRVEPLGFAADDLERQERRQRIQQRMVAGVRGFEEAAPDFGLRSVSPASKPCGPLRS